MRSQLSEGCYFRGIATFGILEPFSEGRNLAGDKGGRYFRKFTVSAESLVSMFKVDQEIRELVMETVDSSFIEKSLLLFFNYR